MRVLLLCAFGCLLYAAGTPVLVELFTSEGCSSCPPADKLLAIFHEKQPVDGAEIITLGEHVTYWDQLGWKDSFSNAIFTRRQADYARRLGLDSSYTPQMVVDGKAQFVGSDDARAIQTIAAAARTPKVALTLTEKDGKWTVTAPAMADADVYAARIIPQSETKVAHGENAGRLLKHVSIVQTLERIGRATPKAGVTAQVIVPSGQRLVVFAQSRADGAILAAAQAGR